MTPLMLKIIRSTVRRWESRCSSDHLIEARWPGPPVAAPEEASLTRVPASRWLRPAGKGPCGSGFECLRLCARETKAPYDPVPSGQIMCH
jgi:hypothetical protein